MSDAGKKLGVDDHFGHVLFELSAASARRLLEADQLACMVHLDTSFRLAAVAKFEQKTEPDSHLICAKEEEGSSKIGGMMLYRCVSFALHTCYAQHPAVDLLPCLPVWSRGGEA